MNLLTYIDKKLTFIEQISYLKSYLFFGAPLGYIFGEVLKYFLLTYKFSISQLFFTILLNLLIASPLIINYYKHMKKYNRLIKKIRENSKLDKVKAIMNYEGFIKGESYNFTCLEQAKLTPSQWSSIISIFISSSSFLEKNLIVILGINNKPHILKSIINKFDLDDIKEERLKKLKRLSKLWKN